MTGGSGPSAFLKISGLSRFVTIRGVEIDGAWPTISNNGIGISFNDHSNSVSQHPGLWTEGILIEDNYVHDVQGEGMYVGPNWYSGNLPLRNIEIRGNLVENTGWDGIQLKSAIGGTNLIHHNVIRRAGKSPSKGQLYGISLLDGTGRIYNNWVEGTGDAGIQHFLHHLPRSYGDQAAEIFNNVVARTGLVRLGPGHGIVSNNRNGYARPVAHIYNNTVVGSKDSGIYVGREASNGFVRDNLVADSVDAPIRVPASVKAINNRVGSVAQMQFVDASALNFRLEATSPARNAGSEVFPPADYDGTPRPQDGQADQGAFEFDAGQELSQPLAPNGLVVE